MSNDELTARQSHLVNKVKARSSSVDKQLLLLLSQARSVGASSADIEAVREHLLQGRTKNCEG